MERTCRVCRCEGTPSQPLFHPCKCRGSIKYIHQECLQFWLDHSHKDSCDICNSKFHFKTIYDEPVPSRIPFKLLLRTVLKSFIKWQYIVVKYSLMLACAAFEFPLVISAVDQIINWQLGVPIPENARASLIFGDLAKPSIIGFLGSLKSGTVIALTYAVILIGMVMIQNSFVGDEGFQKIINKKIGMEPKRFKLEKLLEQHRKREMERLKRQETIHRLLELSYAQQGISDGQPLTASDLQRMRDYCIEKVHEFSGSHEFDSDSFLELLPFLENFNPVQVPPSMDEVSQFKMIDRKIRMAEINRETGISDADEDFDSIVADLADAVRSDTNAGAPAPRLRAERPEHPFRANEALMDVGVREFQANNQQQVDVEPLAEQGIWDGPKNITFIFQLTILSNLVAIIVLVAFKLIPSYVGLFFLSSIHYLCKPVVTAIHNYVYPHIHLRLDYKFPLVVDLFVAFITRNTKKMVLAYENSINFTPTSSTLERLLVQFSGFAFFGILIALVMKKMENSCTENNPLDGPYRFIYIVLLQIVSVVKVLVLIAIEWALFPLFCGTQIEFALAPIFNADIYNYKLEPPLLGFNIFGLLPTWILGTFFMYFFASFVSMIRAKILRTGVLFFIRPSDDPNIQLVHDALMRPFGLRVSRIALSGAVYAIYIHLEFSLVAWLLRVWTPILPFRNNTFIDRLTFASMFVVCGFMEKFFFKYWLFTFKWACSKLRISSFMLNEDNPEERGRIVYKTLFARLSNPKPDYSKPTMDPKKYFEENPNQLACFVPDGNYIRAPDDDHVSRKFVKTLFVPVTKSDQLLEPIPEVEDDEEKFNPYGDVDPLDATTYTIVYRPPHFKQRVYLFFGVLWVSSMIFTMGLYISNIAIGKTIVSLTIGRLLDLGPWYTVDAYSISLTMLVLSQLHHLQSHDWKQWKQHIIARINALRDNRVVVSSLELFKTQFVLVIGLVLGSYPIIGLSIIHDNLPSLTWLVALSMLPTLVSYWKNDRSNINKLFYSSLTIFFIRLGFLHLQMKYIDGFGNVIDRISNAVTVQEIINIAKSSKLIPDGFITHALLLKLFPSSSYTWLLTPREFLSAETYIYFMIWTSVSFYITFGYISKMYKDFAEKTKETYYKNQKILSNADED